MKKVFLMALMVSCTNKMNFKANVKADREEETASKGDVEENKQLSRQKGEVKKSEPRESWQSKSLKSCEVGSKLWAKSFCSIMDQGCITERSIGQIQTLLEKILSSEQISEEHASSLHMVLNKLLQKLNDENKSKLLEILNKTHSEGLGFNILHIAAHRLDTEFITLLLNLGMDVNTLTERDNLTPLMVSVTRIDGKIKETVELLLSKGADKEIETTDLKKVIDMALGQEIRDLLS